MFFRRCLEAAAATAAAASRANVAAHECTHRGSDAMTDPYAGYERLTFDRPEERILRGDVQPPGALQRARRGRPPGAHLSLAEDRRGPGHRLRDPHRRGPGLLGGRRLRPHRAEHAVVRSPGGDLEGGARPRLQPPRLQQAPGVRNQRAGGWGGPRRRAAVRRVHRGPFGPYHGRAYPARGWRPAIMPRSSGRSCAGWPRRSTTS